MIRPTAVRFNTSASLRFLPVLVVVLFLGGPLGAQEKPAWKVTEGDYVAKDFKFRSGESLAELKLHYRTLGTPQRDAQGRVTNAVLILHGTGGTGAQFLSPQFANELYGAGQPLDVAKYFVILPDGIGHGKSSKPSDGMHAKFPSYDYDDMVAAHHLLLTRGLGVEHLRLIFGTSMGCMHSFVWGETYPDFMDALMPLASNPVEIAGRNRIWRRMAMDAIRDDPEWLGGEYKTQPVRALNTAEDLLLLAGSAPLFWQKQAPTRDTADKFYADRLKAAVARLDANDLLYQLDSSREYNPAPKLETIKAPLVAINSADDFINPPELGLMEREIYPLHLILAGNEEDVEPRAGTAHPDDPEVAQHGFYFSR